MFALGLLGQKPFVFHPQSLLDEFHLSKKSILITEHRYTTEYDQTVPFGIYCVQFITFRNDVDGLEALVVGGKATEGMIPKLESCVSALRNGVRRAHILDGRIPHALLLEFFTREGIGTMIDAKTTES